MKRRKRHGLIRNMRRSITRGAMRFISLIVIAVLGTAFYAGVRSTGRDMRITGDDYYDRYSLADIFLLSTTGFSGEEIREIQDLPLIEAVDTGYEMDIYLGHDGVENIVKLHTLPVETPQSIFDDHPAFILSAPSYDIDLSPEVWLNKPRVISGEMPVLNDECLIDSAYALESDLEVGDIVTARSDGGSSDLRITGLMMSPRYISMMRGTSSLGDGTNQGFIYCSARVLQDIAPRGPITQLLTARPTSISVAVKGALELDSFSQEYKDLIAEAENQIDALTEDFSGDIYIFNRGEELVGYSGFSDDSDRIENIGNVYPLILFLVAMLVSLTTMTRMVEEERQQIGTLKALGFSRRAIILPYVGYALMASVFGGVLGSAMGLKLFPNIAFNAYSILYDFPPLIADLHIDSIAWTTSIMVFCMVFSTVMAAQGTLREAPSQLMRPKAPRTGKRVVLERIGFIWRRLNFSAKVTVRNIFRYKKRFFMTIIGIAGCCGLMMTGFGLRDSIFGMVDKQFGEIWQYDARIILNKNIDREDIESIRERFLGSGVSEEASIIAREQSMSIYKEGGRRIDASVMSTPEGELAGEMITLRKREGGEALHLNDDGAIITEKAASLLGVDIGDDFLIELEDLPYSAKVAGITENYAAHYVFMTQNYYEEVFGEEMGYNELIALLPDQTEEEKDALTRELLTDNRVVVVSYLEGMSEEFNDTMASLDVVVVMFIIMAALLAAVVMYNLTNINITERMRELATLRVLGFTYKEMYSYIFRENYLLSFLGAMAGLVLGIGMHWYVLVTAEIDNIMFVKEIKPLSFVLSAVLTVFFSGIINLFMRRNVRSIDMVSSLKSVE